MLRTSRDITMAKLNIFDAIAERSRCSTCKKYLYSSPMSVLSDGTSICGRCVPINPDIPVHRDVVVENILKTITFPCDFKQNGCSERLAFDEVIEHESKCGYRNHICPIGCQWRGVGMQLPNHFIERHQECVKETGTIKLKLDQTEHGIIMWNKEFVSFFFKYFYQANDNNLRYDVRYNVIPTRMKNASFEINVTNASDSECSVKLKPKKCLEIDDGFYNVQFGTVLNLKKFYEILDFPDCIEISIKCNYFY